MPIDQEKINIVKKVFNVSDDDIKRIVAGDSAQIAPRASTPAAPSTSQPQDGGFMSKFLQSRALPIGGAVVGGGIGALAGPPIGIAGAAGGYAGGDIIRKELAGLTGTKGIGAGVSTKNATPEKALSSVTETGKGAGEMAVSQVTGEALGFAFKLLKPNTVRNFLAKAVDYLSKKSTFGNISREALETRFMNEVIPKAMRYTEESIATGEDVLKKGGEFAQKKLASTRVFDAAELNTLRKNLNAIGEGAEGMKKELVEGLARIVREEQIKRAPATGVVLPLEKMQYDLVKGLRAFWPTRMALMISDFAREYGGGLISKFAKYGGGPLIGGAATDETNK